MEEMPDKGWDQVLVRAFRDQHPAWSCAVSLCTG
ncbi:hypothetical protein BJ996_006988 [Streptomyces phaeogriseichromatogenes]|nr:hypothetical protein [Streptomyces murinus]